MNRIATAWCKGMHSEPRIHIDGKYICSRCLREYDVQIGVASDSRPPQSRPTGPFGSPYMPSRRALSIFAIFMPREAHDAFLGDLEERFRIQAQEKGRRSATRWFWRQVILSLFCLAFDALKRVSGLEKLIERYRRIGS